MPLLPGDLTARSPLDDLQPVPTRWEVRMEQPRVARVAGVARHIWWCLSTPVEGDAATFQSYVFHTTATVPVLVDPTIRSAISNPSTTIKFDVCEPGVLLNVADAVTVVLGNVT